ncbi:MAG: discoidin domain-containing protein [Prevotella sp.]|nr:discoidin domain-containing protein [Prevotella sp.]
MKMIGGANTSTITVQGSADGETFTDVEELTISGKQNDVLTLVTTKDFATTDRYVRLLFTKGSNVGIGAIKINAYKEPVAHTLTVATLTNVDLFVFAGDESESVIHGTGSALIYEGTKVLLSVDLAENYVLETLMIGNENHAADVDDSHAYSFYMPEENVTITATATYVAPIEPAVAGVGCFVKVTSTNDITDGTYLIVNETGTVAFNGGLEKLDVVENVIVVPIADNKIPATTATVAATFAIRASSGAIMSASGYYIGKKDYSNGLDTDNSVAWGNSLEIDEDGNIVITAEGGCTLRYNKASDQNRFRYYKTGQQAIQLYKYDATATAPEKISVAVSAVGYATYVSDFDLDYSNVQGLKAYRATVSGTTISFDPVNEVPAGEGVILQGAEGEYEVAIANSVQPWAEDYNAFIRGTGAKVATGDGPYNYILNVVNGVVGFYQANNQIVTRYHAYLQSTVEGARIIMPGETTGIETLNSETKGNNLFYDLQGRSVAQPIKGLYIMNGKKVVVK